MGIVYSTEHGRMCPACGKPVGECLCRRKNDVPQGDGIVRIAAETKGRKGKSVTVITGVPLDPEGLKELGRQLKGKCGAGGSVKNGVIEIQGEHRNLLFEELPKRGWRVRRAGG